MSTMPASGMLVDAQRTPISVTPMQASARPTMKMIRPTSQASLLNQAAARNGDAACRAMRRKLPGARPNMRLNVHTLWSRTLRAPTRLQGLAASEVGVLHAHEGVVH